MIPTLLILKPTSYLTKQSRLNISNTELANLLRFAKKKDEAIKISLGEKSHYVKPPSPRNENKGILKDSRNLYQGKMLKFETPNSKNSKVNLSDISLQNNGESS